jgi:hypothetical protein
VQLVQCPKNLNWIVARSSHRRSRQELHHHVAPQAPTKDPTKDPPKTSPPFCAQMPRSTPRSTPRPAEAHVRHAPSRGPPVLPHKKIARGFIPARLHAFDRDECHISRACFPRTKFWAYFLSQGHFAPSPSGSTKARSSVLGGLVSFLRRRPGTRR